MSETTEIIKQAFGFEMVMAEGTSSKRLEALKALYKMQKEYEYTAEYLVGKDLEVA